jgi:hypothetical protein
MQVYAASRHWQQEDQDQPLYLVPPELWAKILKTLLYTLPVPGIVLLTTESVLWKKIITDRGVVAIAYLG